MLNRTRTSTLDAFGLRDQRNRIYPALTGSDGSTLSLDFTTMSGLDSRFTFSRASNATVINSAGLVQYADSNLFLRSNDFSTTWVQSRCTVTGNQPDPDGGTNAWEILADTSSSSHRVYQASISSSQMAASHVTISVTAKAGASNYFYIGVGNNNESLVARQIFNLSDGTLGSVVLNGSTNAPTIESATATSLGNGWWRLVVVLTAFKYINNQDDNYSTWIGVTDNSSSLTTATSSGASAYFLRAQLSAGPTERPYYETTTSQYHAPRFDHDPTTLAPRGLLLEGSATNLLWPSNTGFNLYNTQKVGGAGLEPATAATGIDGTQSAVSFTITQSGGTAPFVDARAGTGPALSLQTVTANTVYTLSFYWKAGQSFPANRTRIFDESATPDVVITPTSTTDVPGPNGFTRRIIVFTTPVGCTSIFCAWAYGTQADGDTYTVTACQLETGSGASSYIPTGAGTVQRAADFCNMTGADFSSWFVDGSPYSMLFKYSMNNPSDWAGSGVDRGAGMLHDSFNNPRIFINPAYRVASGSANIGRYIRVLDSAGTLDMSPGTLPAAASNTALAFAIDTNDCAVYGANQVIGTDVSHTLLTGHTAFLIGRVAASNSHINGCISLIKYWPQRLPNATLQGLVA
jgi:hypothetical protein